MKKQIKKLVIVALAIVFATTGLFFTSAKEAFAYTTGTVCNNTSSGTGFNQAYKVCASQDSSNVYASIVATSQTSKTNYWIMDLQRRNSDGSWSTVGSRSGYVTSSSPSYRTFTNVSIKGATMKIYVKWYQDPYYKEYGGATQSGFFTR